MKTLPEFLKIDLCDDFFVKGYHLINSENGYERNFIIEFELENKICEIIFVGVNIIVMNNLPMQLFLNGFVIEDKSRDGWESSQKYLVYNYQDDCFKFTCKSIEGVWNQVDELIT